MDQQSLEAVLSDINLPAIRYFDTIDSTNDEAWRWADSGAPHLALVIADEQTAGHGRLNRRWITSPGTGLAFSVVLFSPPLEAHSLPRLTGLGALAACRALRRQYSLPAQVKWPNDILLNDRKAGGILVETRWNGEIMKAAVIGIGINIAPFKVDDDSLPKEGFRFPVTSIEEALGHPVDRMRLLHAILQEFCSLLPRLDSREFIENWVSLLAYRDLWVELSSGADVLPTNRAIILPQPVIGKVLGLTEEGALQLQTEAGQVVTVQVGEIHLKPAASPSSC